MKVEKTQDKPQTNKGKITLGKVLNSPISIIVALALIIVGLLIYSRYLVSSTILYSFSGFNKNISLLNGTIFTNYNINYFGDTKVIYAGDDEIIYDFSSGYYIKNGSDYKVVSEAITLDEMQDKGVSIKDLIEKSDYSFTEEHKDAKYLSKENLENIENLVFRVVGKKKDGSEIKIEIPLTIEKVTK